MSKTNQALLNVFVRRLDGTKTFITKVNANGYSTDAKGPQIPVKRIVVAGKSLKEIAEPFAAGEYIIENGVSVKLTKKQQTQDELDVGEIAPDVSKLSRHVEKLPKPRVRAKAETTNTKQPKKISVKTSRKANTKEQKANVPEKADIQLGAVKRLLVEDRLVLNDEQVFKVLKALGADIKKKSSLISTLSGLTLVAPSDKSKSPASVTPAYMPRPWYVKAILGSDDYKPVKPSKAQREEFKRNIKPSALSVIASLLHVSPKKVKPGLRVSSKKVKYVYAGTDFFNSVFIDESDMRILPIPHKELEKFMKGITLTIIDDLDTPV